MRGCTLAMASVVEDVRTHDRGCNAERSDLMGGWLRQTSAESYNLSIVHGGSPDENQILFLGRATTTL
jgi:hypothetical protein